MKSANNDILSTYPRNLILHIYCRSIKNYPIHQIFVDCKIRTAGEAIHADVNLLTWRLPIQRSSWRHRRYRV